MSKYPSHEPEARREANRLYREKNREKLKAYDAARYAERYAARKAKGSTAEEKEAARLRAQEWRARFPDRVKEAADRWRTEHPDYVSPGKLDRETVNARWRAAYSSRADYYRQKARDKRARKAGVPGSHTDEEWRELVAYFRHACVYCGASAPLTRDHVIPLSRAELGPTNDISNILPACGPCNSRKKDKTDWEYRRWLSMRGPACSPSA